MTENPWSLSPAEIRVMQAVVAGACSNKQIASALGLSEHTINERMKSVHKKMGARCRTAAALAFERQHRGPPTCYVLLPADVPHPRCVSDLRFRSIAEVDSGVTYTPVWK